MEKIIPLFILFFTMFAVDAQSIDWKTLEEAQRIQKENKEKIILIDFYTPWCGFCKLMDKTTFKNKEVIHYINDHFIAVKLDAETESDIEFYGKTFSFNGNENSLAPFLLRNQLSYPSFVFVNEYGLVDKVLVGYMKADEWIEEVSKINR